MTQHITVDNCDSRVDVPVDCNSWSCASFYPKEGSSSSQPVEVAFTTTRIPETKIVTGKFCLASGCINHCERVS